MRTNIHEKRQQTRVQKRKVALAKHRKLNKGPSPSPSQVAAFIAAITQTPLPPPLPGHIRFVLPAPKVNMIASWHDRTLGEWLQCVETWKTLSWFTKAEGDAVKKQLEGAVFQNFRVRWQLRKWILRHRLAITHRNNTDLTDVCTTLPIPKNARVTVYDLPNRKAYYFHCQTIQTLIVNSLHFQQYGISNPMVPKNPYTNLPWSYTQMISICHQIGERLAYQGRLPNLYLQEFRLASYRLTPFVKRNRRILAIHAAYTFFQKKHDSDVEEIYLETLDDMYNEYCEQRVPLFGRHAVIDMIKNKELAQEQQEKWDNLIVAFWIYENHKILINPYTSFDDLLDQLGELHSISHRQNLSVNQVLVAMFTSNVIPPSLPLMTPMHQRTLRILRRTPSASTASVEQA